MGYQYRSTLWWLRDLLLIETMAPRLSRCGFRPVLKDIAILYVSSRRSSAGCYSLSTSTHTSSIKCTGPRGSALRFTALQSRSSDCHFLSALRGRSEISVLTIRVGTTAARVQHLLLAYVFLKLVLLQFAR